MSCKPSGSYIAAQVYECSSSISYLIIVTWLLILGSAFEGYDENQKPISSPLNTLLLAAMKTAATPASNSSSSNTPRVPTNKCCRNAGPGRDSAGAALPFSYVFLFFTGHLGASAVRPAAAPPQKDPSGEPGFNPTMQFVIVRPPSTNIQLTHSALHRGLHPS